MGELTDAGVDVGPAVLGVENVGGLRHLLENGWLWRRCLLVMTVEHR